MKLTIDIPEEIYNHTQEYEVGGFNQENDTKLFMAIKNGIPLEDIEKQIAEKSFTGNDGLDYVEMLVVCKTLKGE